MNSWPGRKLFWTQHSSKFWIVLGGDSQWEITRVEDQDQDQDQGQDQDRGQRDLNSLDQFLVHPSAQHLQIAWLLGMPLCRLCHNTQSCRRWRFQIDLSNRVIHFLQPSLPLSKLQNCQDQDQGQCLLHYLLHLLQHHQLELLEQHPKQPLLGRGQQMRIPLEAPPTKGKTKYSLLSSYRCLGACKRRYLPLFF